MDPNKIRPKLDGILEAIAAGRTCEQILSSDRTLSYRDIFHAIAEAPTGYWRKASVTHPGSHSPHTFEPDPAPKITWHRTD
jgi:hypothetical protein